MSVEWPEYGLEDWHDDLRAYVDYWDDAHQAAAESHANDVASSAKADAMSYADNLVGNLPDPDWSDIQNKPSSFTPSAHTHDDRYYTEAETDSLLTSKADSSHNHNSAYYTKAEVDAMLQLVNYYAMPVWDGSGPHPQRPAGLPSHFIVEWAQPVAPQVGPDYAHDNDRWVLTAGD